MPHPPNYQRRLMRWLAERGVEITPEELSLDISDPRYDDMNQKVGRAICKEFGYDPEVVFAELGKLLGGDDSS